MVEDVNEMGMADKADAKDATADTATKMEDTR